MLLQDSKMRKGKIIAEASFGSSRDVVSDLLLLAGRRLKRAIASTISSSID